MLNRVSVQDKIVSPQTFFCKQYNLCQCFEFYKTIANRILVNQYSGCFEFCKIIAPCILVYQCASATLFFFQKRSEKIINLNRDVFVKSIEGKVGSELYLSRHV